MKKNFLFGLLAIGLAGFGFGGVSMAYDYPATVECTSDSAVAKFNTDATSEANETAFNNNGNCYSSISDAVNAAGDWPQSQKITITVLKNVDYSTVNGALNINAEYGRNITIKKDDNSENDITLSHGASNGGDWFIVVAGNGSVTFDGINFRLTQTSSSLVHYLVYNTNAGNTPTINFNSCEFIGTVYLTSQGNIYDMNFENCIFNQNNETVKTDTNTSGTENSYNIQILGGKVNIKGGKINNGFGNPINVYADNCAEERDITIEDTEIKNTGSSNRSALDIKETNAAGNCVLKNTIKLKNVSLEGNFPNTYIGKNKFFDIYYIISEINADGSIKARKKTTDGNEVSLGTLNGGDTTVTVEGLEGLKDGVAYSTPIVKRDVTLNLHDGILAGVESPIKVEHNKKVENPGIPTKENAGFKHWSTTENGDAYNFETSVTAALTLHAVYGTPVIVNWNNADGTLIKSNTFAQGSTPEYVGDEPTKDADAQYTYTFDGWNPAITAIANDAIEAVTYTAKFTETLNKYTITWKNGDETLETDENVDYGTNPTFDGTTPTKAEDSSCYTYSFSWSPAIAEVTKDQTYTATFTCTSKKSSGGSSSGGGGSSRKTETKADDAKATTGDTAKLDEQKTDESKADETKSPEEAKAAADAQALKDGYSQEFIDAYNFAYKNGITTKESIEEADMYGPLTRVAMAKMLSQYAINVLGKEPDTTKVVPTFSDVDAKLDADYNNGVTLAYQLGIMGIGIEKFRPFDLVTRAEFGTALSRMLFGLEDGEGNEWYSTHLAKLMEEQIITNNNPNLQELRGYVMIMLMRSAQ